MVERWERWSIQELAILKKHYPNAPRDELIQLLAGRGWRSICRAAEKRGLHREHYGTERSEQFLKELHSKLSIARRRRTAGYAPFAGNHHSADAKLAISVSNLYTRGHSIKDIAKRNGITEKEVGKIIEK